MGFVDIVSDLLNFHHTVLIVNLDVGLGTSDNKSPAVARVVDGMVLIVFIEHNVLDFTTLV